MAEGTFAAWQSTRNGKDQAVSTCLLERAEDELRKAGCGTVTLDTTEPLNRAIRFYEKNVFQRTGKIGLFFGMPLFEYSKSL